MRGQASEDEDSDDDLLTEIEKTTSEEVTSEEVESDYADALATPTEDDSATEVSDAYVAMQKRFVQKRASHLKDSGAHTPTYSDSVEYESGFDTSYRSHDDAILINQIQESEKKRNHYDPVMSQIQESQQENAFKKQQQLYLQKRSVQKPELYEKFNEEKLDKPEEELDQNLFQMMRWFGICTSFSVGYFEPSVIYFPETISNWSIALDATFGLYFYQLTYKKVQNINWLWLAGLGSFWLFVLKEKIDERNDAVDFADAIKSLAKDQPDLSDDNKNKLYALYNQATLGDNKEKDPCKVIHYGKEHLRWKAWEALQGMEMKDAKKEYVILVNQVTK